MRTPYASSRAGAWLGFAALLTMGASSCSLVNAPDAAVEAAGGGEGLAGTSSLGGGGATSGGGASSTGGSTTSGATGGATASSSTATGGAGGASSSSSSTATGGGGAGGSTSSSTTSSTTSTVVCTGKETNCDGLCVDLGSSAVNCGSCGVACTGGALGCNAGECLVATELALGREHSCARLSDGTVRCWGANGSGQLGDGSTTARSQPVQVKDLSGVVHVATGGDHSCALLTNGLVQCWGKNVSGQLGTGSVWSSSVPVATEIFFKGDPDPIVQIALGQAHSCARKSSGILYCWGANASGQLGDGAAENRLVPTPIELAEPSIDVALGAYHTCVVDKLNRAACWGANTDGQLGDGTFKNRGVPGYVSAGGETFVSIHLGDSHTCARSTTGNPWCWGAGQKGQLGDGTATSRSTPSTLGVIVDSLALGGNASAALASGVALFCGDNSGGQCGANPSSFTQFDSPYMPSLPALKKLALGRSHACGIGKDDVVRCWGVGTSGQLGDGTQTGMTYESVKVAW